MSNQRLVAEANSAMLLDPCLVPPIGSTVKIIKDETLSHREDLKAVIDSGQPIMFDGYRQPMYDFFVYNFRVEKPVLCCGTEIQEFGVFALGVSLEILALPEDSPQLEDWERISKNKP